jgi:membrane protein
MVEEKKHGFAGVLQVLKQAAKEFSGDSSPQLAAALAYYTLFSIAPLLVLATAVAAFIYGPKAASGQIVGQASKIVGPRLALILQQILVAASKPRAGVIASVISVVTLVAGATGAFASVQTALNQIWEVEPKPDRGIMGIVRDRVPTFLLLFAVGALLVLSLGANTVLSALGRSTASFGPFGAVAGEVVSSLVFLAIMTILFALVFKVLPDAKIGLRDVLPGAAVTAVLFAVGQLLIGLYLSFVSVGSAYGAAGSLIAMLVWLNYSAQSFLFGAELTQVETARRGLRRDPSRNARRIGEPCAPP